MAKGKGAIMDSQQILHKLCGVLQTINLLHTLANKKVGEEKQHTYEILHKHLAGKNGHILIQDYIHQLGYEIALSFPKNHNLDAYIRTINNIVSTIKKDINKK